MGNKLLKTYFAILFKIGLELTEVAGAKVTWLTIKFLRDLIHG